MKITHIHVLDDNYCYLLVCEKKKEAALIDPVDLDKVFPVVDAANVKLTTIFNTHHHWDHAGNNEELLEKLPGLRVIAGDDRIFGITHKVKDGEEIRLGNIHIQTLLTPCHTAGSVSFYVKDGDERAVFTGDTLFIAGCGSFIEGTGEQMHHTLIGVLKRLPDTTKVYPGHEYTADYLRFAASVESDNPDIQRWAELAARQKVTIPSTIAEEKKINIFLRLDVAAVREATGEIDEVRVLKKLRDMKDKFK